MNNEDLNTYMVCQDCEYAVEYGPDFAQECDAEEGWRDRWNYAEEMERISPDLVSGDDCTLFSKRPCDLCDSQLAGARFEVVKIVPGVASR